MKEDGSIHWTLLPRREGTRRGNFVVCTAGFQFLISEKIVKQWNYKGVAPTVPRRIFNAIALRLSVLKTAVTQ